jgi:hypothetical protein
MAQAHRLNWAEGMNSTQRKLVLRANAVWLLVAAPLSLCMDLAAAFFGRGPEAPVVALAPAASIGFVEAHGLALIFGVLFATAKPERRWHFTAAAVHLLLGTCNLAFWDLYVVTGTVPMGYITTILHVAFATLQLAASQGDARVEREPRTRVVRAS